MLHIVIDYTRDWTNLSFCPRTWARRKAAYFNSFFSPPDGHVRRHFVLFGVKRSLLDVARRCRSMQETHKQERRRKKKQQGGKKTLLSGVVIYVCLPVKNLASWAWTGRHKSKRDLKGLGTIATTSALWLSPVKAALIWGKELGKSTHPSKLAPP